MTFVGRQYAANVLTRAARLIIVEVASLRSSAKVYRERGDPSSYWDDIECALIKLEDAEDGMQKLINNVWNENHDH